MATKKLVRKNITIPKTIVTKVEQRNNNFSGFVVEAVKEKLAAIEKEEFEKSMIEGYSDPVNQANSKQIIEDFKYADAETVPN